MKENQERTPLRTILLNFLNHIENLEAHRSAEDSYETEFQELKLFSETLKTLKQYSCSEGEKEVNKKKNRYKDILPFDLSRVILNEYAGIPGSDYINANYIKGASGSPAYIASQGPLPHTINDFWRMVVQCEVQVIVMACNEEEAGKHKCENYWVEGEGEEKQFGMVTIRLIKASTVCPDFSVRTMRLKYTNIQSNTEERTVCQFHYSAWPDHGVPPLVRPLLDMVRLVRDTQASETLPVLVHCSAGCGRTGTICAIDYVWGLLRAGKLTKDFSLLTLVREMRKQRIAMVQTKEQYVLVHQAVRELFKEQLRMIDSHPYENIDCNGMPLDAEPTYDTLVNVHNSEEKKDNKEKHIVAPPLPQKKKFPILSSKQEKEVENLSEKQRIAERAESSSEVINIGGHRPRIAKLKSLFEREPKQVSRSHSLGAPRNKQEVVKKEAAILRVPQLADQSPALPVKRSKSLRVLGSSDRHKLSIPSEPSANCDEKARRLSLESNVDVECKDYLTSVESIVAGLGVRERRNSFREAVNKAGNYENIPRKPGVQSLVRSYTAIDIRTSRKEFDKKLEPSKPILQPKPSLPSHPTNNLVKTPILRPIPARPITKTDVTWHAARMDTRQKRNPVSKFPDRSNLQVSELSRQLLRNQSSSNMVIEQAPVQQYQASSGAVVSKNSYQVQTKSFLRKDNKNVQITPKLNKILPQKHSPLASKMNAVQTPALAVSYKQQEPSVYRSGPEEVAQRKKSLPAISADRRVSADRPEPNPRLGVPGQQNLRIPVQRFNTLVDFDTQINTVSQSEAAMSAWYHRVQPPLRSHNSRHVVFDSRFTNTDHQHYYGQRSNPGPTVSPATNETPRKSVQVYQKPRQLYQDVHSPHVSNNYQAVTIQQSDDVKASHSAYGEISQNLHRTSITPHNAHNVRQNHSLKSGERQHVGQEQRPNIGTIYSSRLTHYPRHPSGQEAGLYTPPAGPSHTDPSNTKQNNTMEAEIASYGVKLGRGSRDDLALCSGGPVTPNRVKRHASVVLLRNSLIENADASQPQLSVWNSSQANGDARGNGQGCFKMESEDPWSGAVGVDLDEVAASMTSQKDGSSSKLMKAALQALHQRKGLTTVDTVNEPKYSPAGHPVQHQPTPDMSTPSQPQGPHPFRKQQQYL